MGDLLSRGRWMECHQHLAGRSRRTSDRLDLGFHKTHPPGELIEKIDGSGKTTLLRANLGLVPADPGSGNHRPQSVSASSSSAPPNRCRSKAATWAISTSVRDSANPGITAVISFSASP